MGMDEGPVVKIRRMNRREEYVGRAINLACRLQSATRKDDPHPQNTIRITSHFYHSIRGTLKGPRFTSVSRFLKNVAGNRRVTFMEATVL
jgi:class 3 adenylate cyclase